MSSIAAEMEITLTINGTKYKVTKEEADSLYDSLGKILNRAAPYPLGPASPYISPTYPGLKQIWCDTTSNVSDTLATTCRCGKTVQEPYPSI